MTTNHICLLIDDDADDREIFCDALETVAPTVHCIVAKNGRVALDLLLSGQASPDIIFLDVNMPLMNGTQFLQERNQRNLFRDTPVVVLTTSADVGTKNTMLALGAQEFVTKPDRYSEWETILTQLMGKFL